MNPIRKQRLMIVIYILIALSMAVAILVFSLGKYGNAFYTPTQVYAGEVKEGKKFRLGGLVMKGSVLREPGELKVSFTLADVKHQIDVDYEGILPDLFREGQGILALGKLIEKGGKKRFVAEEVLAKHDENYMSVELRQALEESGHIDQSDHEPYFSK